jgi:hypothetical protein
MGQALHFFYHKPEDVKDLSGVSVKFTHAVIT